MAIGANKFALAYLFKHRTPRHRSHLGNGQDLIPRDVVEIHGDRREGPVTIDTRIRLQWIHPIVETASPRTLGTTPPFLSPNPMTTGANYVALRYLCCEAGEFVPHHLPDPPEFISPNVIEIHTAR